MTIREMESLFVSNVRILYRLTSILDKRAATAE